MIIIEPDVVEVTKSNRGFDSLFVQILGVKLWSSFPTMFFGCISSLPDQLIKFFCVNTLGLLSEQVFELAGAVI